MNYVLAKKLKDAEIKFIGSIGEGVYVPTLSELIDACGKTHPSKPEYEFSLLWSDDRWCAGYMNGDMDTIPPIGLGHSPEEAVANLLLKLKEDNVTN